MRPIHLQRKPPKILLALSGNSDYKDKITYANLYAAEMKKMKANDQAEEDAKHRELQSYNKQLSLPATVYHSRTRTKDAY